MPTETATVTPTPTPRPPSYAYLPTILKHLCMIPTPADPTIIRLPQSGLVRVSVLSSEADCYGPFALESPISQVILPNYEEVGAHREVGRFTCGTELVFSITPSNFCGPGNTYLSTDPAHCRVTRTGAMSWILRWEDWTDGDFNDTVILIELIP